MSPTTRSAGVVETAIPHDVAEVMPTPYATEYARRGASYWNGPIGEAIRRIGPAILPSMPPELVTAFVAPARATDNTTEGTGAMGQSVPFHEIGLLQVPAGPRDGPAPNPDPRAPNNAWGALANDPAVVAALGRPATMVPNAWRSAIPDQVAVGLANLRGDYASIARALPATLKPSGPTSKWGRWLTMMAFSAGAGGTNTKVSHYGPALTGVGDEERPAALVRAAAAEIAQGVSMGGSPGRHSNRAHSILRTWQKFELAKRIARDAGRSTTPFELELGASQAALEELLARGSLNLPPQGGVPGSAFQMPAWSASQKRSLAIKVGVGLGVTAALGGLAWFVVSRREPVPMSKAARRELAVARAGGWGQTLASLGR